MNINIHRKCCRAVFHTDCEKSSYGGIVQEGEYDKEKGRSEIECLTCGQKGIIPEGTQFHTDVRVPNR